MSNTETILPQEVKRHKNLRLLNQAAKQTLTAIFQAAADTNLDLTIHSATRAVIVSVEHYDPLIANRDLHNTHPLWLLKVLPNMSASHFAILTKSGGPSHTVPNREQARRLANDLIISGEADTVISADLATATAQIFFKQNQ